MKILFALIASLWIQTACAELVVVANNDVKINSLSQGQLSKIFLGQTSKFPDGSTATPLDVTGDVRNAFYTYILKKSPTQIEKYWARMIFTGKSQPPREVRKADVKAAVVETAGGISYMERTQVDGSVKIITVTDGS